MRFRYSLRGPCHNLRDAGLNLNIYLEKYKNVTRNISLSHCQKNKLQYLEKWMNELYLRVWVSSSAFASFHVGCLSWWNWNFIFVKGGKPENQEKNPRNKAITNNKLNPHMLPGRNPTWQHWWEVNALTTAPTLLPFISVLKINDSCIFQSISVKLTKSKGDPETATILEII